MTQSSQGFPAERMFNILAGLQSSYYCILKVCKFNHSKRNSLKKVIWKVGLLLSFWKKKILFSLWAVLYQRIHDLMFTVGTAFLLLSSLTGITPSFATTEDDESPDVLSQFISYLAGREDHWNIEDNTQVFPIPLPSATYSLHPTPSFRLTSFSLSELKYDGSPLIRRTVGERIFYEREVNGENISLEVKFGQEGISLIGNSPETKVIAFGPQSFLFHENGVLFNMEQERKSFSISQPLHYQNINNLRDYLNSIKNHWKGCPVLIYEGTLPEGPRLEILFKGISEGRYEFHPLSPTTLLYALDTVQKKIGVFVKIKLPHFGSQFQYLGEGILSTIIRSRPLHGQIYYDGNHLYQDERTTIYQNPLDDWPRNWGPQIINPDNLDPWRQKLAHFNQQQQPQYVRPLETAFINPECQRQNQGVKRRIPSGKYNELREPLQKKARTIYSDEQGSLSIAKLVEREWSPLAESLVQPYIIDTYFDTGIRWQSFDQDVRVEPIVGSFTDNGRWRTGVYKGADTHNNQIVWEKIDTLPNERTIYQMELGTRRVMGTLISQKMTEEYLRNISYYPLKILDLKQTNASILRYDFLNEIFARMEGLRELHLKFYFTNDNSFERFITLLSNNNLQRNLAILELCFDNCPAFTANMSIRLGTCLTNFTNLQTLNINIPYVRSYTGAGADLVPLNTLHETATTIDSVVEFTSDITSADPILSLVCLPPCAVATFFSRFLLPVTVLTAIATTTTMGLARDVCRNIGNISYEEHLTLARNIANSHSLREVRFYGFSQKHDKDNIKNEIQRIRNNIRVDFD